MSEIGRVRALWRYPVKSMRGETLEHCEVGSLGIPGDRGWAVRDETAGEFRGAKKHPVLMQCQARYRAEPSADVIPPVELELADGQKTASDDREVNALLSSLVGKPMTLHSRHPAEDREHYRRRAQRSKDEVREALGLEPGEAFPDFSIYPAELLAELREFTSPLGTYFDAYPIHLITTSWLAALSKHRPTSRFEAARFRPNLLIEGAEPGLAELSWCGKRLRIGGAELSCEAPTVRCSMTVQETGDLPKDPGVLRTVARETAQSVGAYAKVLRPGEIRVGDAVELL